jgi:hypothetical protein
VWQSAAAILPKISDTHPAAEKFKIERLRAPSRVQRIRMADDLSATVRTMVLAGLGKSFPQASEEEMCFRLATIHLGRDSAAKVCASRPGLPGVL